MRDDFSKYEGMRDRGADARNVYWAAKADGHDPITLIRLLRRVFSLSLTQAKEVEVIAEGWANSLEEHQERLIPALEQALAQAEEVSSGNGSQNTSKERLVVEQ